MSQEIRTQSESTVAKTSMSPIRILALATMVGLIVVSLLIICGPSHDESEYTTSEPCSSSEFYNQKAKPREELAAMKSGDGTPNWYDNTPYGSPWWYYYDYDFDDDGTPNT